MIFRTLPGWRLAGLAAVLGLLGSGLAGLYFNGAAPGTAAIKRPGPVGGPPGLSGLTGAGGPGVGLRLLREAAAACQDTSYSGEQVVMWWGPGETSTSTVAVWHQPGGVTLVRAAGAASGGPGIAAPAGYAGVQDPDAVLALSDQLVSLLQSNYQVVYAGRGPADGREALIVEVLRPGGRLAARFWLDSATKLPLRREMFAPGTRMISEDAFVSLQLGAAGLGGMPAPAAVPAPRLGQARLAALRAGGWPLPAQLPGNLVLFAATQTSAPSGRVIGLSYSDGLALVSLFVQRGELAQPMPGWRPIGMSGRTVYAIDPDERGFTWSAGGFVYTAIADVPVTTVSQVVAAVPGGSRLGFWSRMARGFRRLAGWLNPLH